MYRVTIYFYILKRRKDVNGACPIYCRISFKKERASFSTGLKTKLKKWNKQKQLINETSELDSAINNKIEQIKSHIYFHHSHLLDKGDDFTAKQVKEAFINNGDKKTLIAMIEDHNNSMQRQIGICYSKGTLKNYKTLINHIRAFLIKEYHLDIALKSVDTPFIYRFEAYLLEETMCHQNGAMKVLQRLQKVLNMGLQRGYIEKSPFSIYKFKFQKIQRGYLSTMELKRIMDIKLDNKTLQCVQNMFVFSCFTGLCYIDIHLLKPEQIVEEENGILWVKTNREKTGNISNIPILEPAKKYIKTMYSKERVFRPICNQTVNTGLKKIAKKVAINKPITFHMARHTFGTTITLSNDVPIESVSKMMGHSKIITTQIYARVLDKKVELDMEKLSKKLFK